VSLRRVLYRPPGPFGPAWVAVKAVALPVVRARRRRLHGTTFVGVTGSAGKTTATRLLEAVLATRGPVAPKPGERVPARKLIKALVKTRSRHWARVHELALTGPGMIDELLWAYEPDVAVVTTIGLDHWRAYGSPEAIAPEKAKLVRAVPPDGLAVLNADDPLVRAMGEQARCRVVLYGRAGDAHLRAEDVGVDARGRLTFTLIHDGSRLPVVTRLQGELWLTAVLAAVATGVELGADREEAVRAVAAFEPVLHRLSVIEAPGGVTYLRDDWKGSSWTVGPALDALASMPARRRVAVLGELPDDARRARAFYRDVVREARRRADLVVLVGQKARNGLRGRAGVVDPTIVHFEGAPEAADYLRGVLEEGDVVLLKANRLPEHLERIALSSVLPVACRRVRCTKRVFCDDCRLLTRGTKTARWNGNSA
jgi:UDP-N-acetylmuramoyl-tripeptide--D-alanyl-D-alanine ligase